ncbi:MAG: secretion protein HlyD [Opitutaceae bacterium]
MNKKILLPIGLAVLAAGAWYFLKEREGADGSTLTLQGNVDIREVNLGFRVGGRLASLEFDEGDAVQSGEVMARLDAAPYERAVEDAVARVASLRSRVKLVESGYRPEEVDQARASVEARRVGLANAERRLVRETELRGTGASAAKAYDDALAARDEAVAQVKLAEASLALLVAGFRSEDIEQARANLAAGEAALASARIQVDDAVLRAPSDGVVLTRVVEPGTILGPGATVYSLSLTRPVWVRAYVSEPDLGRIRPGQKVEVATDTDPGKPCIGQIGFISPTAEFTPKTVETKELRTGLVYRLRIVVEDSDDRFRQGMPVTVRITGSDAGQRD